jgi:DNA-binding winged helix-turn-helix (wHTH) protein/TolB-like protein/Tfp pilus assembly protein PilF
MERSPSFETLRFRDFELDVAGYELRRLGRPVKLGQQAMDVLILLVERRRQLVSRSDIVERLWGKDVFVDVETGVNTAISKIRQALRDPADAPAFVETVTGKGYRFIAPVEVASHAPDVGLPASPPKPSPVLRRELSNDVTTPGPPGDLQPANSAPSTPAAEGVETAPTLPRGRAIVAPVVMGLVVVAIVVTGFVAWTRLSGGALGTRISLTVLPFESLGSDPDRAYLAAGLTEETSALLGQIDPDRLSVKGRTLHYKDTNKTAVEIGRELSVDYLLASTIRAEGNQVRVTTTLIRVRDQEHVWSQSYDRPVERLLVLQQELSAAIAEQVRLRLSPDRLSGLARRQTQKADAYDAYLRARYLESRRTPGTNAQAIQQYERAIALDPNYALAWSGLAFTYAASTINGDARPLEMGPRARDAAARAVRANPNLAEAQVAVGYVNWLLDWDWSAADSALRLAIGLDASYAPAYRTWGHALSQAGRDVEAESAMRRSRELEPFEPLNYALSSQVAFQTRDYPAAVEHARQAVLLDSAFWIGSMQLAQAYEQLGETDLALTAITDAERFSGGNSKASSLRGYILAKTGRAAEARAVLRQMEGDARTRYVPPFAIALVHAGLGERDAVFEWLDKAYAARDVHLIYLPVDPKWDAYRSDPRFVDLLARCGFTRRPKTPSH